MSSPPSYIETGVFQVRRHAGRTAIRLQPFAELQTLVDVGLVASDDRTTKAIARAQRLQQMIDGGEVRNRAELAARLGISRARVSQILRNFKTNNSKSSAATALGTEGARP